MHGTGVPVATPFTRDGRVDEAALVDLVGWLTERGVDFLVPGGSTSEAPLLTIEERARVVELVVEAAPADVPVIAGTGHPGLVATVEQTRLAAAAGADGVLVVTPFYYPHDQAALAAYYRDLADESDLPVYLYSIPKFADVRIAPETAADLAAHENVVGMKDSSGDLAALQRTRDLAGDEFDLLVGAGSIYGPALDAGVDGGILAVANVAPEAASEVHRLHRAGDREAARSLTRRLAPLNRAITAEHGIPGLKAAMRHRDAPAGHPRSPFRPVTDETAAELRELVDRVVD